MKEATILKKAEQVNELLKKFQESKSLVFVDHLGLTVAEISELRNLLYKEGCDLHVFKNNIIKRTANLAGIKGLDELLVGPNAVAFSKDATSASKIIFNYAKSNDKLGVKAGVVEGKFVNAKELKVLSSLPDKNGMIAMLLSVLEAPIRNLGIAIKAVAEKQA